MLNEVITAAVLYAGSAFAVASNASVNSTSSQTITQDVTSIPSSSWSSSLLLSISSASSEGTISLIGSSDAVFSSSSIALSSSFSKATSFIPTGGLSSASIATSSTTSNSDVAGFSINGLGGQQSSSSGTTSTVTSSVDVAGFIINGLGGAQSSSSSYSTAAASSLASVIASSSSASNGTTSTILPQSAMSPTSSISASTLPAFSSPSTVPSLMTNDTFSKILSPTSHASSNLSTASRSFSTSALLTHTPIPLSGSSLLPLTTVNNATRSNTSSPSIPYNETEPSAWIYDAQGPAASCYTALWQWHFSSSSLALKSGYIVNSISWYSYTVGTSPSLVSTYHHEVTTLCDGYARAIGPITDETSHEVAFVPRTFTVDQGSFSYSSMPCQIAATDCSLLWNSYYISVPESRRLPPPCATTGTVDWDDNICRESMSGLTPDEIELIYWPARLNYSNPDFCASVETELATSFRLPITASGTRTGIGPNTVVVSGVTITSPDVGILLKGLRAMPDCGTTIDTVLTTPLSELQSAEGRGNASRVVWQGFPYDLNNLNWVCEDKDTNAPWTTQFHQDSRCYQDVPASAYFGQLGRFIAFVSANITNTQELTIMNNYNAAIDMDWHGSSLIELRRIFGPSAFQINAWQDPPVLVTPVNSLLPATSSADPTTPGPVTPTSAAPQQSIPAPPTTTPPTTTTSPNAQPQTAGTGGTTPTTATLDPPQIGTTNGGGVNSGNAVLSNTDQAQSETISSPLLVIGTGSSVTSIALQVPAPSPGSPSPESPGSGTAKNNPAALTTTDQNGVQPTAQAAIQSGNTLPNAVAQALGAVTSAIAQIVDPQTGTLASQTSLVTQVLSIGDSQVTAVASGSDVIIGGATLSPGQVTTINGQQFSLATANSIPATTATIGGSSLTVSDLGSGSVLVNGQTVTSGAAQTLPGGVQVSLGSSGLVVNSGSITTTIKASSRQATTATVAGSKLTISDIGSGSVLLNGQTITQGSAQTLSGLQVSLGSNGLVVSSGSITTTLAVASKVTTAVVAGSSITVSDIGPGSVLVNGRVVIQGAAAQTIGGVQVSLGTNGLVVKSGLITTTIAAATTAKVAGLSITVSDLGLGLVLVDGRIITQGDAAQTLSNGMIVSLGSDGLVVNSGSIKTTIATPKLAATTGIITIDGQVISVGSNSIAGKNSTGTPTASQSKPSLYQSSASRIDVFSLCLLMAGLLICALPVSLECLLG